MPYELDRLHARMRAVVSLAPSIAGFLVARAGGQPSAGEVLLPEVRRALASRAELGLDYSELELVIFQLRMLLLIPNAEADMDEMAEEARGGDDVLEGWFFERLPMFETKAPYDLDAREARVEAITFMCKSIARHVAGRFGPGKPVEPGHLMHAVWNSLNNRDWLGLSKEEASILLIQLHFLLAASIL